MCSYESKFGLFLLTLYLSLAVVTSRSFDPWQPLYSQYYPRIKGGHADYDTPSNLNYQYRLPEDYYYVDQPLDDLFYNYIFRRNLMNNKGAPTQGGKALSQAPNQGVKTETKKGLVIPCAFNAVSCFGK